MARDIQAIAKPRSRFKRPLWLGGIVLLLVGGAYLGGRLQMQARLDSAGESLNTTRHALQAAEQREASQHQELRELEARRRIHLAIMAFEQNNFGTAQEQLRAASSLLGSGKQEVASLAASLRTLELSPTLDLAAQRGALAQLASKFDALRPPQPVVP